MRLLLFSITISISLSVFAQFDRINLGLVSSEQEFIKSALDSAVFILRQDYVLIDTFDNRVYTQENKDYFGRFYSLAILTDSILITTKKIFEPYKTDTAYNYYKRRYGWKAEVTSFKYRELYSNSFNELDYEVYNYNLNDTITDSLIVWQDKKYIIPRNIENNSLQAILNTEDSTGWTFLVYMDQDISICDTCAVKYSIFKTKPDFNNNGILERQIQLNNVIGGFYIIPKVTTGIVRFKPAGIIKKNEFWFVEKFKYNLQFANCEP